MNEKLFNKALDAMNEYMAAHEAYIFNQPILAKLIEQPEEKQTFDSLLEMAEKFAAKYE